MAIKQHPSAPKGWGIDPSGHFAKITAPVPAPKPTPAPTPTPTPAPTPTPTPFEAYFKQEKAKGRTSADILAKNPYMAGGALYQAPTPAVTPTPTAPDYTAQYGAGAEAGRHLGPTEWARLQKMYDPATLEGMVDRKWNPETKVTDIFLKGAGVGAEPTTPTAPGEPPTKPGEPPTKPTDEGLGLTNWQTKFKDAYDKAIKFIEAGYTTEKFDKAGKRTELEDKAKLGDTLDEVNSTDKQIDQYEGVVRRREEELREQMKSRGATESDIVRELAGQLRPIKRALTDLYVKRDTLGDIYNRSQEDIDTELSDLEEASKSATKQAKEDYDRKLKAYELGVEAVEALKPEKKAEPKAPVSKTIGKDLYERNPTTGKWEKVVTGKVTPKAPKKTDVVDDAIKSISVEMNPDRGEDGFINPKDWKYWMDEWVKYGKQVNRPDLFTIDSFIKKFKSYKNPEQKFLHPEDTYYEPL